MYKSENNSQENNRSTLVNLVKAASVFALAYLAYQKRDKVNQGWKDVKSGTNKIVQPIADGLKSSSNKFQDYVQNKTEDATEAFNSLSTQIEDKYHGLEGQARDTYATELKSLREKLNKMIDNNDKAIKDNKSNLSVSGNSSTHPNESNSSHKNATVTH